METASQEFLHSLTDSELSRCLDNLVALQKRGLALSHWVVSLMNSLVGSKRYILVIQLSERYVETLLEPPPGEPSPGDPPPGSLELLCYFLLLHQHSPFLFHRTLGKLTALVSAAECVSVTVQSLVLRYPHFGRLYGKLSSPTQEPWCVLNKTISNSRMRFSDGVGFNNMGNTCYFNSLIQALWLSVPFQSDVVFSRVDSSILTELRRVFLNLSYSIRTSFSPDTLFHVVRPPWFAFGSQQDSAELLRHMFDLVRFIVK